jgi:cell division septation protein DedD
MKNREFRELQVSSTQLAVIFLGILIIGVVIFLLGVSVGKKHAQIAQKTNIIASEGPEQVKEKIVLPEVKPQQKPTQEPTSQLSLGPKESQPEKPKEAPKTEPRVEPKKEAPKPEPKKTEPQNLYYVQVGALAEKPAALSSAQRFKAQGFAVVVLDPLPTDRKPVYRVRVGGFPTKEEAEAARAKLAAAAGRKTDYFIVRD